MTNRQPSVLFAVLCVLLLACFAGPALAQVETMAWGNLTGIRIDGHLMELNSSMCVVQPDWAAVSRTGRERQTNNYARNGKIETVRIQMRPGRELRSQGVNWTFSATEVVEDTGAGSAKVDVEYSFPTAADVAGAYYCLELPAAHYAGGSVQLIEPVAPAPAQVSLAPGPADQNEYLRATASGLRFTSPRRQLEVMFNEPTEVVIRDDRRKDNFDIQVYLAVIPGKAAEGQSMKKSFALKAGGDIDKNPVEFVVDATRPGQMFDGLGGNFRLQNAATDPPVIQYNLDNLRIAWGRVEMPWSAWQPTEDVDPLEAARAGKINPRVQQAMEMARRLAQKGMPIIVSAWSAPAWAVLGTVAGPGGGGFGRGAAGVPGAPGAATAPATAGGRGAASPGGVGAGTGGQETPGSARSPGGAAPGATQAPTGSQGAGARGAAQAPPVVAGRGPGGAPGAATAPGAGVPAAGAPGAPGGAGAPFGMGMGAPRQPDGPRGNPLNPEKMDRIKESIAGYLLYLKEKFGVEAAMFSFNESDLGINVRQTAREHAQLIKTLGPQFASKGLATKLELGDTSDANPIDFIKPAMHDPEAVKYIGAVGFHSWRGCTDEILAQWRDAARALNVPLIVAEGSTDAAAYRYPQIFMEQSFAFYEINLYTRILAIAQPKSILQWQMTADYSLLAGGGIFGDKGPLRPTQRYWNLKQLASTPPRSFALPVKCGRPGLACAAFGNIAEGAYALHIVNNGAARPATITGLPPSVEQLRIWVTDAKRGMQEGTRVPVAGGKAQFTLDAMSYTTLISGQ